MYTQRWKQLLEAAMLESNPEALRSRLDEAEAKIKQRLRDLLESGGSGDERRELEDAIYCLRALRKEKT